MKLVAPCLASVILLVGVPARAQPGAQGDLTPAGSINSVFSHGRIAVVVDDDPAIKAYARLIANRFFKQAEFLTGGEALKKDLRGRNLIVYGTVHGNAWLRKYCLKVISTSGRAWLTKRSRRVIRPSMLLHWR